MTYVVLYCFLSETYVLLHCFLSETYVVLFYVLVTDCRYPFISSVDGHNGTFTSPQYPNSYPTGQTCRYTFHGEGKQRVQLRFEALDLHYTAGDPGDPYE